MQQILKKEQESSVNKGYFTWLLSLIIGIAIFVLCSFFVWTHDDYTVTSSVSISNAFSESLSFGNGRYLGNFFVKLIMSRGVLDVIVRTICIWVLVITSAAIVDKVSVRTIILSSILFLGMGMLIFREVFVWGHGFYNYVPPVTLLMMSVYFLKRYYVYKKQNLILLCVILSVVGFSQQLFSENSTTVNLLVSLLILIIVIKQKLNKIPAMLYFIFSAIGSAVMFFGPSITGVAYKMDEYRNIDGLMGCVRNALINFAYVLKVLSSSFVFWTIVSAIFVLLFKNTEKGQGRKISILAKGYIVIFPVFSVIQNLGVSAKLHLVIDAMFVVYLFFAAIFMCKLTDRKTKRTLAIFSAIIILSVLQLLVVSPIGARCLFITYTLMSVALVFLCKRVFDLCNIRISVKSGIAGTGVLLIIYGVLLTFYINIWQVNCSRIHYAQEQIEKGSTQVEIIKLPYEYFLHYGNESYAYAFSFNQGNRDEMSFTYIDYEDYLKTHKNNE